MSSVVEAVPGNTHDDQPFSDRRVRGTVYFLAAALILVSLLGLLPLVLTGYWNPMTAPGWATAILMMSVLQLAYVLWMLTLPDWSTVWVVMIVFTAAAALYGMGLAICVTTPQAELHRMPLGLAAVRGPAFGWCGVMVTVTFTMTYLCGRTSYHWRRSETSSKATGSAQHPYALSPTRS